MREAIPLIKQLVDETIYKGRVDTESKKLYFKVLEHILKTFDNRDIESIRDVMDKIYCKDGKKITIGGGNVIIDDGEICVTPTLEIIMRVGDEEYKINTLVKVSYILTLLYNIDTIIELIYKAIDDIEKTTNEMKVYADIFEENLNKTMMKMIDELKQSI